MPEQDFKKEFIDKFSPVALKIEAETGVPAYLILSQAALESNWGRSGLTTNDNNFFGIKGSGDAGSARYETGEIYNGRPVRVMANFRKYSSPEASFRDHARLLTTSPNYAGVMEAIKTGDPEVVAKAIHDSPYATALDYDKKIMGIIREHDLDKLSLQKEKNLVETLATPATQSAQIAQPIQPNVPTIAERSNDIIGVLQNTLLPNNSSQKEATDSARPQVEQVGVGGVAPILPVPSILGAQQTQAPIAPKITQTAPQQLAEVQNKNYTTELGQPKTIQDPIKTLSQRPPDAPKTVSNPQQRMVVPTPGMNRFVTVRSGDSLSKIAQQHLGSANRWRELSGFKSGNPNLIYPGEKIRLPS